MGPSSSTVIASSPTTMDSSPPYNSILLRRFGILSLLFVLELVALTSWLDTGIWLRSGGILQFIPFYGPWILRSSVAFGFVTLVGAFPRLRPVLAESQAGPIRWAWAGIHVLAIGAFVAGGAYLASAKLAGPGPVLAPLLWLMAGMMAIVSAALTLVSGSAWAAIGRGVGRFAGYGFLAAAGASLLGAAAWRAWKPVAALAFNGVVFVLRPFIAGLTADPLALTVITPRFGVEIARECSGLEGMGLMLAFSSAWLWFYRDEFRFPRALLLLPISIAAMMGLNIVRVASLIAVGHFGWPEVALGGFHSQAGWIAFNLAAVALAAGSRSLPWFTHAKAATGSDHTGTDPKVAAYLVPFLAILATGMITRATSHGFEWLYPLRFVVAASALWWYRREYRDIRWSMSWFGVGLGVVVLALWMGLSRGLAPASPPEGFRQLPQSLQFVWLGFRVLAAVVTVPIAEELAFRGFLQRRLVSADFSSVDWQSFLWMPVLLSSLLFGFMHGELWVAGTLSGLLFSFAVKRNGRLGDAVAAHATANLMLAGYALFSGNWQYW